MAGIADIRTNARAALATVTGVAEALKYPPNVVAAVPCVWLSEAKAEVIMGQAEKWLWVVKGALAYSRKADYGQELEAAEAFIEPIAVKVRANVTLGGTVSLWNLTDVASGIISVGGVDHTGLILTFGFTEFRNVSLSG